MSGCGVCVYLLKLRSDRTTHELKCDTGENTKKDDEASLECATESANWAIDYMKSTLNRIQCVCCDFFSVSFNAYRLLYSAVSRNQFYCFSLSKPIESFTRLHYPSVAKSANPFFPCRLDDYIQKCQYGKKFAPLITMCVGVGVLGTLPWLIAFLSIIYKISFFLFILCKCNK